MNIQQQNITILYVEDDDSIRLSMLEALQNVATTVIWAVNGEDGLNKYTQNKIDLIITDINMPVLNGFDMLIKIRQLNPNAFAIILSGYGYSEVLDGMSRVDKFNDYLAKPIKFTDLYKMILNNIEKIQLHEEHQKTQNLLVQYKNVIDRSAIVVKTDIKGIVAYVNNEFTHISGFDATEVLNKKCHIFNDEETLSALWASINSKKEFRCKITNQKTNGELYVTDTFIFPIYDLNDQILEFAIVSFDITEHIKAVTDAKNAERAKSSFLAQMSHEIRTPLNGIIGFSKILEKCDMNPKELGYVKTITKSASHLLYIINEILDFSKIENGKIAIENIVFEAKKEFEDVIDLFSTVANDKGVNLVKKIDSNIPSFLKNDPFRIKQVISNLLSNAIKFTNSSKDVTVAISLDAIQNNICTISFKIIDQGIGIKKENQEKVFTSFSQADESISRNFGGTGLGLSISSSIIQLLGGKIELESEFGRGSQFSFTLNFEIADETMQPKTEPKEICQNKLSNFKVLVADDNHTNRLLIDAILEAKNINRVIVEDGEQALNEAQKTKFDLILMDINMPILDGMMSMKQIKEFETLNKIGPTPIIALTANSVYGDKEKYLKQGFDGYLSKPIDTDELDEILSKFLEYSQHNITNIDTPISSEYNISDVASALGIGSGVVKMLVTQFLSTIYDDINKLKNYIANNDFNNSRLLAHSLKGASGSLKITQMYEILSIIETESKENHVKDIDLKVDNLINIATSLKDSLEKL